MDRNGYSQTKLYNYWAAVHSKCCVFGSTYYNNFGAKGIAMCTEWCDFISFMEWAISNGYQEGDKIRRYDMNEGYTPENCYVRKNKQERKPFVIKEHKTDKPVKKKQDKENKITRKPRYNVGTTYPNRHPLYSTWIGMKTRCYNPNHKYYKYYGGKGVYVCDEWKNNFNSFYNWMIENGWEQGLTIDRKDGDKPYEPDNCQLITQSLNSIKHTYQMFFSPIGEFNQTAYNEFTRKISIANTKYI